MELNAKAVQSVLQQKGVDALYHANTVQTACTFLNQGHLLARGVVAAKGLPQTSQQSDKLDKEYSLWYDIFLDGVDVHERATRRNYYGPVLFVFDINLLAQDWLASLWMTKDNPQNWKSQDTSFENYFTSIDEVRGDYQKGNFGKHIVLRHIGGALRLQPFLKKVILDNPGLTIDGVDVYSQAIGALKASARTGGLTDLVIEPRPYRDGCTCITEYSRMLETTINRFFVP